MALDIALAVCCQESRAGHAFFPRGFAAYVLPGSTGDRVVFSEFDIKDVRVGGEVMVHGGADALAFLSAHAFTVLGRRRFLDRFPLPAASETHHGAIRDSVGGDEGASALAEERISQSVSSPDAGPLTA